jgi:hypothetical protein
VRNRAFAIDCRVADADFLDIAIAIAGPKVLPWVYSVRQHNQLVQLAKDLDISGSMDRGEIDDVRDQRLGVCRPAAADRIAFEQFLNVLAVGRGPICEIRSEGGVSVPGLDFICPDTSEFSRLGQGPEQEYCQALADHRAGKNPDLQFSLVEHTLVSGPAIALVPPRPPPPQPQPQARAAPARTPTVERRRVGNPLIVTKRGP